MSVVIGTNVYMKLYITIYYVGQFCASGINIYSDNYIPDYGHSGQPF